MYIIYCIMVTVLAALKVNLPFQMCFKVSWTHYRSQAEGSIDCISCRQSHSEWFKRSLNSLNSSNRNIVKLWYNIRDNIHVLFIIYVSSAYQYN